MEGFEGRWKALGDVGAKGNKNNPNTLHRVRKGVDWSLAKTGEIVRG